MPVPVPLKQVQIVIPDLAALCPFPLKVSPIYKASSVECRKWFFKSDPTPTDEKRAEYDSLNPGLLAAMVYPDADDPRLQACIDFLAYIFYLDNLTDDMDNKGSRTVGDVIMNSFHHPSTSSKSSVRLAVMGSDFIERFYALAKDGCRRRFLETFDMFLQSLHQQACDRTSNQIPSLEEYISLRRDTSGCRPCWAMIELANDLNLPDYVMDTPIIRELEDLANDLVSFSNDIFSYDKEQAREDTHNMLVVVMNQRDLTINEAIDYVAELSENLMNQFVETRSKLPSWGEEIDKEMSIYLDGLQHWMIGILNWSFLTERYFGKAVADVKESRIVKLTPHKA